MNSEGDNSYFITNGDGYRLYCRQWKPKGIPGAMVFISHGFAEHSQYYDNLAQALAKIGCVVHAHDHVGHGRSWGPRAQIDDITTYVRDVFKHTDLMRDSYPNLPCYYFGHSMGSAIGMIAALKIPNYFRGIILMGTAIFASHKLLNPFTIKLCHITGWMFPKLPCFPLDYNLITRDPDTTIIRINDPLSYHGFSKAGWTSAMLRAMKDIENNVKEIRTPLLIMHGMNDKICSVKGSKFLYQSCSSTDKTLKIYPDAFHNLLDEPEGINEEALKDITAWLVDRFPWPQPNT